MRKKEDEPCVFWRALSALIKRDLTKDLGITGVFGVVRVIYNSVLLVVISDAYFRSDFAK